MSSPNYQSDYRYPPAPPAPWWKVAAIIGGLILVVAGILGAANLLRLIGPGS